MLRSVVVLEITGSGIAQPLEVDEVAARLVELAAGEPAGRVADMGGPRVIPVTDLARSYLRATGRRLLLLLPVPLPGKAACGCRAGLHLAPDHAVGRRTWEEYLAAR